MFYVGCNRILGFLKIKRNNKQIFYNLTWFFLYIVQILVLAFFYSIFIVLSFIRLISTLYEYKLQIEEAGIEILASEEQILTEENARELYKHKSEEVCILKEGLKLYTRFNKKAPNTF